MMDGSGGPVETEEHGLQVGGHPVTHQVLGGMHGGQDWNMVGPGWRHPGEDPFGMAFPFETGQPTC